VSDNAQDLRTSLQMIRRHKAIVLLLVLLGLLAGYGYNALRPPVVTSDALVVLPGSVHNIATQAIIADSDTVLSVARTKIEPTLPLPALRSRVIVASLTANVISITAQATTTGQAEDIANAVADSYIAYAHSANDPAGPVLARILEPAAGATGGPSPIRVLIVAFLGGLAGLLIGAVLAVAIGRGDRRLRYRDEFADAIGVPVLASLEVSQPSDLSGWVKLLEDYRPTAVEAWRLRGALHHLGLADVMAGTGVSVAVVSRTGDRRALAVGPQLASFAASLGVPTTLVFGTHQVPDVAVALRAACGALAEQPGSSMKLRVAASDLDNISGLPDLGLAVVVSVVDSESPSAATVPTDATVLAVSAGAATAEQLARAAASTLTDGRSLAGIIVADPDPADHTTGRLPLLVRPAQHVVPARVTGKSLEPSS
jgi:capsular polysaccharide biosynthesis protein